jgi:hypothetical protein
MQNFKNWRKNKNLSDLQAVSCTQEEFLKICMEYFSASLKGSMKTYFEHRQQNLFEAVETSRYAIQVNYRTKGDEALEGFAKICLGYISAALKKQGYHTKHVFDEKPLRLMVAARNWDDGEWIGVITWHHDQNCFVVSKGFYNKDRKTVSIQSSKKCAGESAAEITKELHNMMHHLKGLPDRHQEKLKPVPLKRGPKK